MVYKGMIQRLQDTISRLLRSPRFFYVIIGLLVLQAAWIALTARYPQAFDENYHFGLIQLHAEQLLPFFTYQPPGAEIHGAVVRDPSYLFHYLMTFPYHLLRLITDSETVQIIALRFLNIAIFVWGLFVYRKLFSEMGVARSIMHAVLLFFVLTPIVPLLAGHINYDNLMFALCALLFLYMVRYVKALQSPDLVLRGIPLQVALQIILVGAVGSIVKFPFAPIFFAVLVVLVFMTWRARRRLAANSSGVDEKVVIEKAASKPEPVLRNLVRLPGKAKLVVYSILVVLAVGLCIERYGINLVRYQAPVPKCDKVLSVEACLSYSPWARDYNFAKTYPDPTAWGIFVYPAVWVHRTVFETMFTISSQFRPDGTVEYKPVAPLTINNYAGWTVVTFGILLALYYWRRIWQDRLLRVLLLVIAFYGLVLFLQNFQMYIHSGEAVAIHGRYWIPVYPVLYLVLALGFAWFLQQFNLQKYKALLLTVTLILFMQGGGITGWIIRSDPSWYWQHSSAAAQANWWAKDILYKIVWH